MSFCGVLCCDSVLLTYSDLIVPNLEVYTWWNKTHDVSISSKEKFSLLANFTHLLFSRILAGNFLLTFIMYKLSKAGGILPIK